jgi:hypothetical protein
MISRRHGPAFLALFSLAAIILIQFFSQKQRAPKPSTSPQHESLSQLYQYRVGHDWVETPVIIPKPLFPTIPVGSKECQDIGCRTCRWMKEFGGEW